jgi:hypothetical protein
MIVVIFCFILAQSLFKIFRDFRYEKLMVEANYKWEVGGLHRAESLLRR